MSDLFKKAAEFVREQVPGTRSSHSHAVIAHALGYSSKKALLDDENLDRDDVNLVLHVSMHRETLEARIAAMGDTPLKQVGLDHLERVVHAALAPACECCEKKDLDITPLGDEEEEPAGWVCGDCADDEAEYGHCIVCRSLFRDADLNRNGECPEHAGEFDLDPEEEEDYQSFVEYHTKDL